MRSRDPAAAPFVFLTFCPSIFLVEMRFRGHDGSGLWLLCLQDVSGGMSGRKRNRPESIMARAIWNGRVIAESNATQTVEGNVYFPEASLKREYFHPSTTTSLDPRKGQARYMSLLIDGQDNQDAAWYYPDPKPLARKIKGYVAFWRGVEIKS
jgi:uncharacterized protein (DUF427 family)